MPITKKTRAERLQESGWFYSNGKTYHTDKCYHPGLDQHLSVVLTNSGLYYIKLTESHRILLTGTNVLIPPLLDDIEL